MWIGCCGCRGIWERLLEFSDRGLTLGCAHGQWDLGIPNDRFILRVEVAHACRSSDDASRRVKRRFETLRRNGVAHACGRSFWFPVRSAWLARTGRVGRWRRRWWRRSGPRFARATVAVLAGESYARVAAQWNAAGLRTAGGKVWVPVLVRAVLVRARNAGLVEHDGVVVGQMLGEPIVERADFERLRSWCRGGGGAVHRVSVTPPRGCCAVGCVGTA